MRKEIRIRILLRYGILYAMGRHKAWRGGSKAPLRGVPAIALDLSLVIQKYQKFTAPFGFDFGVFEARFWKFCKRV